MDGDLGRVDPQALGEADEWLSQGRNDVLSVGQGLSQFMRTVVAIGYHLAHYKVFLDAKTVPMRQVSSGDPKGINLGPMPCSDLRRTSNWNSAGVRTRSRSCFCD